MAWLGDVRVLSACAIAALVGACGGFTYADRMDTRAASCTDQIQLFASQDADLRKSIGAAQKALATVEGQSPAVHTAGYTSQPEGKKLTADLKNALADAEAAAKADAPTCGSSSQLVTLQALTNSRGTEIAALSAATTSFTSSVDAYRLASARREASGAIEKAKAVLDSAQQNAEGQLKAAEGDASLQADPAVKGAYDALKKVVDKAQSWTSEVTYASYTEAVASINDAKKENALAADINAKNHKLSNAIQAHRAAGNAPAQPNPAPAQPGAGSPRSDTPVVAQGGGQQPSRPYVAREASGGQPAAVAQVLQQAYPSPSTTTYSRPAAPAPRRAPAASKAPAKAPAAPNGGHAHGTRPGSSAGTPKKSAPVVNQPPQVQEPPEEEILPNPQVCGTVVGKGDPICAH